MDSVEEDGIPEVLVKIMKSFHSDVKARVRLDGEFLDEIGVSNGLRQGCTMAPDGSVKRSCCCCFERVCEGGQRFRHDSERPQDQVANPPICSFDWGSATLPLI